MSTLHVDADGQAGEYHNIVPSISITHLLQQRAAVLERITQAFALIEEADRLAAAAHLGFPYLAVSKACRSNGEAIAGSFSTPGSALRTAQSAIDAAAWRYLMQESGMRSLMSASKRQAFDEQVNKGEMPELTRDAIEATFGALHEARGTMFEQGAVECFKRLSWAYKTNQPQKFGKRIVVRYLSYAYGLNHSSTDQLDDLMRVFHVLDGKPEPDYRCATYALITQATREQHQYPKTCEHPYFSLKLFGNGNGHLCFKRLDLVDALNRIIAKHFPHALPAPR
jgi:hypothetical protein